MKRFTALFLSLLFLNIFSQKLSFQTLLRDKISIRAIEIWKGRVYYAGTDSKFGFVSIKDSADRKQFKLSYLKEEFRTLAQDPDYFFTVNIGSPAKFYRIDKRTLRYEVTATNTIGKPFYDAMKYIPGKWILALSDPNGKCVHTSFSRNSGQSWHHDACSCMPNFYDGEAAFAASNTNIDAAKNSIWFATGGIKSRIFRMKNNKWETFDTPFVQGKSSQGIYSIDFFDDKFGIAVGGDYTKQTENINNIATTFDGGETWQIQASGKNSGYKTCVKIRPGSKGKEIIAVGDQNIEFSNDFGKSWTKISDEKNLYTCIWVDKNTLVFAGKDRILKANFKN